MTDSKDLQAKEKREVSSPAEQTTPGFVFTPEVDILETEGAIMLLADMPGVSSDNLDIDLRENTLTLSGVVQASEASDEEDVIVEYEIGKYYRQFTISEVIDQSKIEAVLNDGVLRLTLPKAEKAKPKKIAVTAG
jgi:HSP20 family molecular chaperone IbpA